MFKNKMLYFGVCAVLIVCVGSSTPAQAWHYTHPRALVVEPVLPFGERVVIGRPHHRGLEHRIENLRERIAVLDDKILRHPYNRGLRIERGNLVRERDHLRAIE